MLFDTPRPMVSADRALSNRSLLSRWNMRSNVRMIWWDFFFHFVANRLLNSYRDLSWSPGVLFSPKCPLWSERGLLFVSVCFATVRLWFFYFFSHSFFSNPLGECLPPKNSVHQLNHRVEFSIFFSKVTLAINHDIPKWCQYKNWFSDTLLFIEPEISITSHENNPLVNSRPETFVILVKHTINEQGASKNYWNVAMSYCIAWLDINTKNNQHPIIFY